MHSPKDKKEIEFFNQRPQFQLEVIADFQATGESTFINEFKSQEAFIGSDSILMSVTNEDYDSNTQCAGEGIKKENASFASDKCAYKKIISNDDGKVV